MQGRRRIALIAFAWPEPDADAVPPGLLFALREAGFAPGDLAAHRPLEVPQGHGYPGYGYLYPAPDARSIDDAAFGRLHGALARHLPQARAARLQALMEIDGASVGMPASHHYVVETDVVPQAEADLNAWYDREHLPGLAAVPGTVRAARYRSLDGGPRYHACYELATQDAFGSAPWLAVRATDWSSRVRPAFVNTRRMMFRSAGAT
jgi:hypothetical protein